MSLSIANDAPAVLAQLLNDYDAATEGDYIARELTSHIAHCERIVNAQDSKYPGAASALQLYRGTLAALHR